MDHRNKRLFLMSFLPFFWIVLAACTPGTDVPASRPMPTATSIVEPTAVNTSEPVPETGPPIRFAFVRDNGIYLYEDGAEMLVVRTDQQSTQEACSNLFFPFLSPDGKYLAYIEKVGEPPEDFWGCSVGYLNIVEIAPGTHQSTDFAIRYFRWTDSNLLNFSTGREVDQATQTVIQKNIYFDPASQEEMAFETVVQEDPATGGGTMISAEYPTDNLEKLVRYEDNAYYLVDTISNEETFLFDDTQVVAFIAWSPSGRYVIFESVEQTTIDFEFIELVVDTQELDSVTEIVVGTGGAGGDISTGRKWYFEQGFATYCREELYFIDGRPPLPLTNDGGGGCNNEEGFVATSPGGNYAFLKFQDRFELHDRDGNITVVQETEPVVKGRWTPKNFIWLNDDYMIMYESISGGINSGIENPKVYLFDRRANIVKPLIENAYLVET